MRMRVGAPEVFTTGQVAKILHCAPRTVSKWFDSGRLRGYRIPGSDDRRIPREDLVRFLKDHGMPLNGLEDGRHRVLLVGTGGPFGDRLRDLLPAADGFDVRIAAGGFEAGLVAAAFRPAAAVVDLGPGRADGVRVAAGLRACEGLAGALVVGLAGEDEADPAGLCRGGWFDRVFAAPADPAAVAAAVRAGVVGGGGNG